MNVIGAWQPYGRRGPGRPARAGEVLGAKTVAELADMIHVASFENDAMLSALSACTAWLRADPRSYGDFSSRVEQHSLKLPPLVAAAERVIDAVPSLARSAIAIAAVENATGTEYDDLIAWRKGLWALDDEFRASPHAHGCTPPNYQGMPQPKAEDVDLDVLHAAEAVTKPIDRGLDAARDLAQSRTPYVLVGFGLALAIAAAVGRRRS